MTDRLPQLLKLHAADPRDPFCTYAIALEHAKAGRAADALHWLDQTLAIDPRYCYAYYHKAKVLAKGGQVAEAKAVLQLGLATAKQAGDRKAEAEMGTLLESLAV